MAADGMIGNGCKLAYSSASPVSWIRIGQLLNVGDLEIVRDKVDRTVHSTSRLKRSLPGMADVSDITLEILQDLDQAATHGAVQKALRNLEINGTTVWWRYEIPVDRAQSSYKAFEFQAYILSWRVGTTIEDRQVFEVTVAFDGDGIGEYDAGASQIS